MDFLIITGLSGAGKSRAADVLEDLDYYCVDNLPVALMPKFAELCIATGGRYEKVALVTDVRAKNGFDELLKTLDQLKDMNCACRILILRSGPLCCGRFQTLPRSLWCMGVRCANGWQSLPSRPSKSAGPQSLRSRGRC